MDAPDRLAALQAALAENLDFHRDDGRYASHGLHAFPAKFPPQLPRLFIDALTQPGDVVLDPMVGSGTTLVEAMLAGRPAFGFDIDPLAVRVARSKVAPIDLLRLQAVADEILAQAEIFLPTPVVTAALDSAFDGETRAFLDYWFLPETQRELMALRLAIDTCLWQRQVSASGPSELRAWNAIRNLLAVVFSSIIITKSGGVSLARDLAHSRPHKVEKQPRNAVTQFERRLRKHVERLRQMPRSPHVPIIIRGDARALPLAPACVDLVVTSPPYANAIDYLRAHKFSLVWMGRSVTELATLRQGAGLHGHPIGELAEMRGTYLGTERRPQSVPPLPGAAEASVRTMEELDPRRARILRRYFADLRATLREMGRVLRPGGVAVVVVGSSVMRGHDVQTQRAVADLACQVGFVWAGTAVRHLDRNRRLMPASAAGSDSSIEQRMREEFVIGLYKQ